MVWTLRTRGRQWRSLRPWVMGIVNITPDSFSDGGRWLSPDMALTQALQLVAEGADILDLGAASSRPGSLPVAAGLQLERLLPVIEKIRQQTDIPLSVDTSDVVVMREVIAAGALMINDINALQAEGAIEVIRQTGVACCLMHMQGTPDCMQDHPQYHQVTTEVLGFLEMRWNCCLAAGINPEMLCLDPGFGFGKQLAHNIELMQQLRQFSAKGPLLIGVSRKSMLGELLGHRPVHQRQAAGVAMAFWAAEQGAAIIRTHDVQATRDVLTVWETLRSPSQ